MVFLVSILLLACFIVIVFQYWGRLVDEEDAQGLRWFRIWVCKGVATPIGVWMMFNSGILPGLPSWNPELAFATGVREWLAALFGVTGPVVFLVGSCWAAVTFAWLILTVWDRIPVEHRSTFIKTACCWSILLGPLAWVIIHLGGWGLSGVAFMFWLLPIAHAAMPLLQREKPLLLYSKAIAHIKFGKFNEAEWEVIRELEKCEDDFDGWMLLAGLYADHFKDLATADQTIRDLCHQPNVTPSQVSVALHRLADWHLKLGDDPVAASRALEEICQRMPGSHLERMARQRSRQLPATREGLLEQRKGRKIRLPGFVRPLVDPAPPTLPPTSREAAATRATRCVELLKQNPNNVPEREQLAALFAESLDRSDLGFEQLELLIGMPGQPAEKTAEWLWLSAAWHVRYRRDQDAAKKIWERLVREYPQTSKAVEARRRLSLMEVEQKLRKLWAASSEQPSVKSPFKQ